MRSMRPLAMHLFQGWYELWKLCLCFELNYASGREWWLSVLCAEVGRCWCPASFLFIVCIPHIECPLLSLSQIRTDITKKIIKIEILNPWLFSLDTNGKTGFVKKISIKTAVVMDLFGRRHLKIVLSIYHVRFWKNGELDQILTRCFGIKCILRSCVCIVLGFCSCCVL